MMLFLIVIIAFISFAFLLTFFEAIKAIIEKNYPKYHRNRKISVGSFVLLVVISINMVVK